MRIKSEKVEMIAHIAIKVLGTRLDSFPSTDFEFRQNRPFHKAFLEAFKRQLPEEFSNMDYLMGLSSWIQGLNTTLGQTFFERTAQILGNGTKKDFTPKMGYLTQNYVGQGDAINRIMTSLRNGSATPNAEIENEILLETAKGQLQEIDKFTIDMFSETDEEIVAIELKTVHPSYQNSFANTLSSSQNRLLLWISI
jgi:hypothetical protein